MAGKLTQNQLEVTFEFVKDFVVRFIDHVDPEANQVKSTFFPFPDFSVRKVWDTNMLS
jgi:hypothetical protein